MKPDAVRRLEVMLGVELTAIQEDGSTFWRGELPINSKWIAKFGGRKVLLAIKDED